MILMGSDHRCVMTTFTIVISGKSNHDKTIKWKHYVIKYEGRDQTEKIKLRSLSSKKDTKRSSKKSKEKPSSQKKAAAQAESEDTEAQIQNEKAAAEAKSESTVAEAEEVEGTRTGTMMYDSVGTTGEVDGRHSELHTVYEETDHIFFTTSMTITRWTTIWTKERKRRINHEREWRTDRNRDRKWECRSRTRSSWRRVYRIRRQ